MTGPMRALNPDTSPRIVALGGGHGLYATLSAARLEEADRTTRVRELERQLDILRQVIDNSEKLTAR